MTLPPPATAFFLPTSTGSRFCLYHAPAVDRATPALANILHVHAFAEEMNKCRRMAALHARALAVQGCAVLQIDLYGCGDSSGDFADARWDIWKTDLDTALEWLQARRAAPVTLWGDRLGALLALDYAREQRQPIDRLLLWQPVFEGKQYMTQFLRLRLAHEILDGGDQKSGGTQGLRTALQAGQEVEVAGYALAPDLVATVDTLSAGHWHLPVRSLHWLELTAAGKTLTPARQRVAQGWQELGNPLQLHALPGTAFWNSQEVGLAPAWLDAGNTIFGTP